MGTGHVYGSLCLRRASDKVVVKGSLYSFMKVGSPDTWYGATFIKFCKGRFHGQERYIEQFFDAESDKLERRLYSMISVKRYAKIAPMFRDLVNRDRTSEVVQDYVASEYLCSGCGVNMVKWDKTDEQPFYSSCFKMVKAFPAVEIARLENMAPHCRMSRICVCCLYAKRYAATPNIWTSNYFF